MRHCLFVLACLLLAVGACHAQTAPAPAASSQPATASSSGPAGASSAAQVDLEDIRTFTRVYDVVKRAYVDPLGDAELMRAAMRGLLSQLDPHSALLSPEQLQRLSRQTRGEYVGIGIKLAQVNGQLKVIAPLDGSPAARAGIRAGDIIVSIDGRPVTSDKLGSMADRIGGPPGTTVSLTIKHAANAEPQKLELVRERIQVPSVEASMLAPGYALLRIGVMQRDTAHQLRGAIQKLQQQHALAGAVLDLRANPGGLLSAAVAVSDLLLDHGDIVSTRGRLPQADRRFSATAGDLLHGAPLVVLVDHGTASAAEIVAGALKDNQRAVIMGEQTFGKGSVQSILTLDNGYAVKITTARYYTPDGTSIQAEGIRPDIVLGDYIVNPRRTSPSLIVSESDLPHHLINAQAPSPQAGAAPADIKQLARDDYALSAALHVLKGMVLAQDQSARPEEVSAAAAKQGDEPPKG